MKKVLRGCVVILVLAGLFSSCQTGDRELGEDLLPSGDEVILLHDTIFQIHSYPVTATPYITSEKGASGRLMLLGTLEDTIVGRSKASIVSQFNTNPSFISGPNMEVDSLLLFLNVQDYVGNMNGTFTLRVYEFEERIYPDSVYFSNYDPQGKFDPVPLAEKDFTAGDTLLEVLIEDQDFLDKFLALGSDTSLFKNDTLFKDYFNGLYIEAESVSEQGLMARVLINYGSLLSLKYANDSTQIDTTAGKDYRWANFSINEFYPQKINLFEHDFTGTYLSTIVDVDSAESPYAYVQGMAGVNTRFSLGELEQWMDKGSIAISSARLVLEVVPEEESGILQEELPDRLIIGTILGDGTFEPVYDHYVLSANSQNSAFGGYLETHSEGLFSDTTYRYVFRVGLHFQAMVDRLKQENDFILQISDMETSPKKIKLWGNPSTLSHRIRLEVAYLEL